ncbi:unnamed protein product [Brachionus calyciflorus]|uniref:Uncharacterized protein n=1 Tax=Brachionus calyciflorus TaxID=104777 RepID=A0A813MLQ5_9BILA|nr:unnamed protein product [Brachionus calyciflorus]
MLLSFFYPLLLLSSLRNQTDSNNVKKLNSLLVQTFSRQKYELEINKINGSKLNQVAPQERRHDVFSRLPNYKFLVNNYNLKNGKMTKRQDYSAHFLDYLMDMYERKMSRKQSNEERDSVEATSY